MFVHVCCLLTRISGSSEPLACQNCGIKFKIGEKMLLLSCSDGSRFGCLPEYAISNWSKIRIVELILGRSTTCYCYKCINNNAPSRNAGCLPSERRGGKMYRTMACASTPGRLLTHRSGPKQAPVMSRALGSGTAFARAQRLNQQLINRQNYGPRRTGRDRRRSQVRL
jgi:hypothetical protein